MNLIMGATKNLDVRTLAPFLNSAYNFHCGPVVVFCPDNEEAVIRALSHINGKETFRVIAHPPRDDMPVNVYRWFLYRDYFSRFPADEHVRVLFTDMRDVLFQGDPLTCPGTWDHPAVHCFLEPVLIGLDPYNAVWVNAAGGHGRSLEIARMPVSCSGTVIASGNAIAEYLEALTGCLSRITESGQRPAGPWQFGWDQGAHNHIIRGTPSFSVRFHENGDHVLTLLKTRCRNLELKDGSVCGTGCPPAAILHQYDRMEDGAAQSRIVFKSSSYERYTKKESDT